VFTYQARFPNIVVIETIATKAAESPLSSHYARHVIIRAAGIRVLLVAFAAMPCVLGAHYRRDARAEEADVNMTPPIRPSNRGYPAPHSMSGMGRQRRLERAPAISALAPIPDALLCRSK
jgi:hypothetical protein